MTTRNQPERFLSTLACYSCGRLMVRPDPQR